MTLVDQVFIYLVVVSVLRLANGIRAVNEVLAVAQAVVERVIAAWSL